MTRPVDTEHELEILRAVAAGLPYAALAEVGPWALADVDLVLQHHRLTVTAGGTIVRVENPEPLLQRLAADSPSPRVRQAAGRAAAAMTELARLLAVEHAKDTAEDILRRQRHALGEWFDLLTRLRQDASIEIERLRAKSPKTRLQRVGKAAS